MGGPGDPARLLAVATAGIAAMTVIRYAVRQIFSKEDEEETKDVLESPETTRPATAEPSVIDSPRENSFSVVQQDAAPLSEADMVCAISIPLL